MANNNQNQPKRVEVKTSAAAQPNQTDVKNDAADEKELEKIITEAAKAAPEENIAASDKAAKEVAIAKAKAPIIKPLPIMQTPIGNRALILPVPKIHLSGKTVTTEFKYSRKINGHTFAPGVHKMPVEFLQLPFVKGLQNRGDISVIA